MTKKDYELIARVLKRHKPKTDEMHALIVDLCNALYLQNKRFNTKRFMEAIENENIQS